ncbi:hypothetical protein [Mycobacterium sp. 236(2023)]|uniref:hypothetical protein n=1 Tax=Mycobacterium sp. 236(2023) TaxID=3038163 RepID=UPI0024153EE9|nr:hypothetical protein [Mycobacterium sp. 236(2023)]MDG4668098.1 hypothetical protein [Mycobacterium sp. 236(2023)]
MTSSTSTDAVLFDDLNLWRPPSVTSTDLVDAGRLQALAAVLDREDQAMTSVPPLWHWVYFTEWPASASLGPDGNPRTGDFLPPIPQRRQRLAGARFTIIGPLLLGHRAVRVSELVSARVKHGHTGHTLYVTVRHTLSQSSQIRIIEEHDLVYRSATTPSMPCPRISEPLRPSPAPWTSTPVTHPALLFRFSALTANTHRIHYDQSYARDVEGFPTLVVHQPLLALYLAELARTNSARQLYRLDIRFLTTVFAGDPFRIDGTPSLDGAAAELSVNSGVDTVHAIARAEFA